MLRIELVRYRGRLVGRTVSDRWNLWMLGYNYIRDERNQATIKCLRRAFPEFTFTVPRDTSIQTHPTPAECDALGRPNCYQVA